MQVLAVSMKSKVLLTQGWLINTHTRIELCGEVIIMAIKIMIILCQARHMYSSVLVGS